MSEPRAYFSGIKEVVSEHLQKAQKSIIVAVAWFTEDELFFQLLRCAQQGLDVQLIIMDDPINQGSGLDYQLLVHHGAKVWFYPDGAATMHHKFCLIDNNIALTGSFNWTRKASLHNSETLLRLSLDDKTAKSFTEEFKKVKAKCQLLGYQVFTTVVVDEKPGVDTVTGIVESGSDLQLLIQLLQAEVNALEAEKTFWQQAIEAFERLVHARIGHILLRFMDLQRRLAEMQAKLTRKFADQEQFQKQQKSYFDFKEKVEQDTLFTDALPNLDASEEKELKSLYREALFMAHPDHFHDDAAKEARANHITAALTEAYRKKDLAALREIWQSLQDGYAFDLQAFDQADAGKWLKYYEKLLLRKQELLIEIDVLKANELYPYVANNTGVDEYAEQVASHLNLKIEIIQKEIKTYE